ncbi:MAG: hypothetical protein KGL53_10285, partial [Elusimicrobia bacterium]|nr:hypothetical protein [Elusimicrobiota bacterium]
MLALAVLLAAAPASAAPLAKADAAFVDQVAHRAFRYFWEQADPRTGLVPDRAGADGGAPRLKGAAHVASVAA